MGHTNCADAVKQLKPGIPFNVVPDNLNPLPHRTIALSFGTAGTLHVLTVGGADLTIPNGALAAGAMHRLRIAKVFDNGTTAQDIVGYY